MLESRSLFSVLGELWVLFVENPTFAFVAVLFSGAFVCSVVIEAYHYLVRSLSYFVSLMVNSVIMNLVFAGFIIITGHVII